MSALFGGSKPDKPPPPPKPIDTEAAAQQQEANLRRRRGFLSDVLNRGRQTGSYGGGAGVTVG